ncbi:MAG: mdoH [Hydrocarboniphaga sp.]|uniref:glucans biosynthesis glucosyltransferase MdoH n=1 Tax=Hydrocarboniphaga sp. TaxID=2033016 RepID=UPI00262F35D1|nr:glucans biosynthesis glucosyltransferase MdoH [Hydrocarboniphaga sp.]MDB5972426.1 mdoH [Hydrocarboniphaga sp.]
MNDHHVPTAASGGRIKAYLERLRLSSERREKLLRDALAAADPWTQLHTELSGGPLPASAPSPAWQSMPERLHQIWPEDSRRLNEQLQRVIQTDNHGRTRLHTMPPIQRAFMKPRPWATNPFQRLWRASFGRRGRLASRLEDDVKPDSPDPIGRWRWAGLVRRLVLLGFVLGQTYIAVYLMTAVLPYHGSHWLEMCILVLYAILFAWVGSGFWTALMGFWVLLWGRDKYSINGSTPTDVPIAEGTRTAILVPIFNEDVARVFAGVRATYDSIARTGKLRHFEFFVLSDTIDSDTRVAELQAWLTMCREVNGFDHIHYRRRTHRIRRKSGNVADWCRRWGSGFNYMVVLDADSVMSGDCLVRLTQLMEANPSAGIIQTAPWAAGRETMYARIQQFSTRVYGPLFTAGLHFWQLGESHYWGHNAILRVAPFMRHCALSKLPGSGSLSGEILSHDFVEAALMRRAGWSVWIAYDLPGSWEEMPPTLLDELKRDRRWCQGNLMNFRLFLSQGLHPAHRAVFMTGVMAYLSAPLWFLFLVLSTALLAVNVLSEPVYFTQSYQLFPNWPEWHPEWATRLFGATATLLWLPKLLSAILIIAKPKMWRGFGGPIRLFFSVVFESVFSAALAPIRMLFHAKFVTLGLLGVAISWKSPPRDDAETHWSDAIRQHWGGSLLGLIWAGGVYWLQPEFLLWLLPVVGSLMLAIPLSVLSSRVRPGRALRAARMFLIPEESLPPRELRWMRLAMRRGRRLKAGFLEAVVDPVLNALLAADSIPRLRLSGEAQRSREQLIEQAVTDGPEKLSERDRNTLLSDPISLSRAHQRVWSSAHSHADWTLPPA